LLITAAADAGADGDIQDVVMTLPGPEVPFAQRRQVGVVSRS